MSKDQVWKFIYFFFYTNRPKENFSILFHTLHSVGTLCKGIEIICKNFTLTLIVYLPNNNSYLFSLVSRHAVK